MRSTTRARRRRIPGGRQRGSIASLRGGSWYLDQRFVRAALRLRYDPGDRVRLSASVAPALPDSEVLGAGLLGF